MALTFIDPAVAIGASSALHGRVLQGTGGIRARSQAHCQLVSFSLYNSSSRSAHCILSSSKSKKLSNGLVGALHKKLALGGQFSNSGAQLLWGPVYRRSPKQVRDVTLASLAGSAPAEVAANLFQLGTAFVVPFYTVMILAPKWEWTKKMMENELTYFILGAGYIYLLCLSWTPETLGLMFSSKYWLPELPGISRMFASTITVASAWLHLLAADLFAGRQIFLDGLKHDVETRHSLVLCLMMCPIGIFCHLVTKSVVQFSRRIGKKEKLEITNDLPPCAT